MSRSLIAIGLLLLGSLSPVFTFTALFQKKEWRLDRLKEHLRRDGWFTQLFGKIRPIIIGPSFLFILYDITTSYSIEYSRYGLIDYGFMAILIMTFLILPGVSLLQFLLSKQHFPVITSKAIAIIFLSISLSVAIILWTLSAPIFLPFAVFFQPLYVLLAWLLLKPIDFVLKKRVMDRAMQLRSQMKDATVIGIAGSVGKTTVKELIAHLLQDLHPLVTPAHVNTEMGVANWLIARNPKSEIRNPNLLIIEMGAYRKGEIALLAKITQPSIGVMTALGSDHLALFGSEEAIVEANGELISALPSSGHAFFYGDNAGCQQLAKHSPCPVTIAEPANHTHTLEGRHNDYNVSLAVTVAKHLGMKDGRIAELLKTFQSQAHTFDVKTERGVLLLDDTYNISPLSFHAALDWAGKQSERPRVLLTSGLQETGKDEDRFLTELGTKASKSVERVIFTNAHGSDNFAKAFGKPVEILNANTERVITGSTLLAVGRMPLSIIYQVLPTSSCLPVRS